VRGGGGGGGGGGGASYEVTVAAQLMLGGDLLQRACATRYTATDVKRVAHTLAGALVALDEIGVDHVDLAPWTLLYEAPSSAALDRGLVITNAGFGAPKAPRGMETPLHSAFDAPEVHAGGSRDAAAAMWTLGRLMQLLLCGDLDPIGGGGGRDGEGGGGGGGGEGGGGGSGDAETGAERVARVSEEARILLDALTKHAPAARPRAKDLLSLPWIVAASAGGGGRTREEDEEEEGGEREGPPAEAEAATSTVADGGEGSVGAAVANATDKGDAGAGATVPPLLEAQERLNSWYDNFLFEGMTARLAEMSAPHGG
jgi:hypothetical protein